jgi:hypothetical protein
MSILDYIFDVPRTLPPEGGVIVHNHVQHEPLTVPGMVGFQAWTQSIDDEPLIEFCDCGWSGLPHYRVVGST